MPDALRRNAAPKERRFATAGGFFGRRLKNRRSLELLEPC